MVKKFFSFLLLLLAVGISGWLVWQGSLSRDYHPPVLKDERPKQTTSTPTSQQITATLSIEGFSPPVFHYSFATSTTVLEYLRRVNQDYPALNLKLKDYQDLGVLVVGLGTLVNGQDNKYWHYFVNGNLPLLGADKYIFQDGDLIEWKFIPSQF